MFWGWRGSSRPRYREPSPVETQGAATMKRLTLGLLVSALLVAGPAAAQTPLAMAGLTITSFQTPPGRGTTPPATQTPPRPQAPPPSTTPANPAQAPATPPAAAPKPPTPPVPFPADAKMGFVNMQQVVAESKLGKTGSARAKDLSDKKMAEIQAKNAAIQKLNQEVSAGANVLSAAVLAQKNSELAKAQNELQFMQQQAQTDVDNLQNELFNDFLEKVLPICEELRAEKNLWVIWNLGEGSNVTAVNKGLDLSDEIVKRLDVKFPK